MIAYILRGWITVRNAPAYQDLLFNEIFPAIAVRDMYGYRDLSLLRRDLDSEVEFATIMWFSQGNSAARDQRLRDASALPVHQPPTARATALA